MSCFGGRVSSDLYPNCCNGNTMCEFDGNMSNVCSEPIYVQKVYDAVLFNLQGMKNVQNQCFYPPVPEGSRVRRVIDIRCQRYFNPCNVDDARNLKLDVNTTISGATFLQNASGECLRAIGPDGTFSEKILYANTLECDEKCMGTPVFGTQNISVSGNAVIELDLMLCDRCNHESVFTVSAEVNIATDSQPMVLTNFFEICMPTTFDTSFLPRFTEFCNTACEARLATNNAGRDLNIGPDGQLSGNLIIALCITCEKKIIVPVQMCVLSTGLTQLSPQVNSICTSFPTLFPNQIRESDTIENCEDMDDICDHDCQLDCCDNPCHPPKPKHCR